MRAIARARPDRRSASAPATGTASASASHSHAVARKNCEVAISARVSQGNVCRLCS